MSRVFDIWRSAGRETRRRTLAVRVTALVVASLLAGCGSTASSTSGPVATASGPVGSSLPASSGTPDRFGAADVQRAVEDLASIGIDVRLLPSDTEPMAAVGGVPSAVRFLRFQVRNMALELALGTGTRGADLDTASIAGGGGPVAALIDGWARSAGTPAAAFAASALARRPVDDPVQAAFPSAVLAAFLADVTQATTGAAVGPGSLPVGHVSAALAAVSVTVPNPVRVAFDAPADFCANVGAYVSSALAGIVASGLPLPAWLRNVIDTYAPAYKDDPDLFRRSVGAIALVTYATSIARAWTVQLTPEPSQVAYGIEGDDPVEGEMKLVVFTGQGALADEVADCADLARVELPPPSESGAALQWDVSGLGAHAQPTQVDPELDEGHKASFNYETSTESKDAAANGTARSDEISVAVRVDRAEVRDLADIVQTILVDKANPSPASAVLAKLYQAMAPQLLTLMLPAGSASVTVTHHVLPTPSPTATGADGLTGTWNGTWAGVTYATTAGDFTVVFVQSGDSLSGSITITGTPCLDGGTVDGAVAGDQVTFGVVQGQASVSYEGAVSGDTLAGTWTTACGKATGTWEASRAR